MISPIFSDLAAEYRGNYGKPLMPDKLPKDCSHCENSKTIHLTQIVGGQVKKLDICSSCKLASEASNPNSIDIVCEMAAPTIPSGGSIKAGKKNALGCPSCGFTEDAFKEFGRLGCPHCYEVFAGSLEPVLRKAHRGLEHQGKMPEGQEVPVDPAEIESLKESLKEYVAKEEYEKAAELRDRIWELESKL